MMLDECKIFQILHYCISRSIHKFFDIHYVNCFVQKNEDKPNTKNFEKCHIIKTIVTLN